MMKIAITGSTGLVGTALVEYFKRQGHAVTRIVRSTTKSAVEEPCASWDIEKQILGPSALEGHDVVIHLAGANIAAQRWTSQYKKILKSSRVQSTQLISKTLTQFKNPPQVFFSASATGFYGQLPPDISVDEDSPTGSDFLSEICREWEAATKPAEEAGIRVVHMRFGVVLSPPGGALAKMLPIFKLGLGGKLGSGKQMFSWIALDEIPFLIEYLITKPEIAGPINFVSPQPVSNLEFTKTLGSVIHRPTIFPAPAFAIKLALGEMGETLLLNGVKVLPRRLMELQYPFKYARLEMALKACLC